MTKSSQSIKCVVWDLDDTLWDGVLLEDPSVRLKTGVKDIIEILDNRGILQSVASKNNHEDAVKKLEEFGIAHYFLYPQIHWNSKVQSIRNIKKHINIGMDAIAFVDDNPAELGEVAFSLPEVLCINARDMAEITDMECMIPRFTTSDQKHRRQMYLADISRNEAEEVFVGPKESFLATLGMELTIFPAGEADLKRAEELTVRTNQLNATGYTYSYEELDGFRKSSTHQLIMAKLVDRYGTYGHIGLALIECDHKEWRIKLLLMSCRVMSRGVGSVLLNYLIQSAISKEVKLKAEFVPNERNRMMNVTYRFAGFEDNADEKGVKILEHPLNNVPAFPDYMKIKIEA